MSRVSLCNYDVGQSAAFIVFRGHGAANVRHTVFIEQNSTVGSGARITLNVVPSYVRPGARQSADA